MNNRLSAGELSYIVGHSEAKVLIADYEYSDTASEIARAHPELVVIHAGEAEGEYESLLDGAGPYERPVEDETDLISLNYTSGTTGRPKGVMYHHRGAYLQALAMAFHSRLDASSGFLWTLPMFHCNGWCFTWAVTAAGGTHLCLRRVDPGEMWSMIRQGVVTHFNAAPTVLTMLARHEAAGDGPAPKPIAVGTGGSPPSPTLLEEMAALNMDVNHLYGLTETFGPVTLCEWMPEWSDLAIEEQARLKSRQGVGNVISETMRVVDQGGQDVPADAETIGEVALRGNNLMQGYYRDDEATSAAIPDGWFRTGDLGVMHPDGYVELRDRAKDIIISGGENIASIEVEQAIVSHPAVSEAAVVAAPDDLWGEIPVAFVDLREGQQVTEAEIIEHVRDRLAHFKAPTRVVVEQLPKTSTGKVQKYVLRERAEALVAADVD
jgi:fatty-acyl-CoA synthase